MVFEPYLAGFSDNEKLYDDENFVRNGLYRTAEECFNSSNFKYMMSSIFQYIKSTSTKYPFNE